jgi:ClpP class serine protease
LIAHHIRALAKKHKIPVYAFVEDVAASGGYWLACAADKIYAAETAITGSIGVISASFGFQDFIDKYGIERRIVTSGKDKSFLDPFVSSKPADVKRLKAIQGELHQSFIDWVKQRRGKRLKGDDKTLFEGAFWTSKIARDLGIIDGIADMRTHCKSEFGDDVKFIPFAPNTGLLSTLMGGDSSMQTSLPEDILSLVETRSLWARFGL